MQIKDLSITANNGTTPVVFTAVSPQTSTEPATWLIQDPSKPRSAWPRFTTRLRTSKGNASTIVSVFHNQPIDLGANGVKNIKYLTFTGEYTLSNDIPPAQFIEFENNIRKLIAIQVKDQVLNLQSAL